MSEKRQRGMGRLFMRGVTWWCQYYFHGTQVRVSTGETNEKKAAKFLRTKIGKVEAGVHGDTRKLTYEELREAFYQDYIVNKRKSLRRDKDGAPRLDKVARLDAFFEGYRASEIDADVIRRFIADQQAKGLANATANRSVSALRRMFHLAKQNGRVHTLPYFPIVEENAPRSGFFEHEQYQKLLAELPDYLRLPFSVGYFTGMREGEILGLEWDQVKFLTGTIELLSGKTKSGKRRSVPIIPQLRTLLVEQHAKRQPNCAYVCYRLNRKGHAVRIGKFRKAWYSACIRAKLGTMEPKIDRVTGEPLYAAPRTSHSKAKPKMIYRGMLFHDTRRSGVRNLVRAGVPEKVAMAISGHATRSVFDRYDITSGEDFVEAGRKLELFHSQKNGDKTGTVLHQTAAAGSPIN